MTGLRYTSKGFVDNYISRHEHHILSCCTLEEEEVFVSFDVVSLFTNVPTDLAVTVARRRLLEDETLKERTCLDVDEIIKLLQLCLDATYVCFRGVYFQQTFGTAMGSPVSVTVANLVMEEIEQQALSTFDPPPKFWKRYVDDTCTALPADLVSRFHQHLNSINEHLQFTLEKEEDVCLPFLDILLKHEPDGSIQTLVHHKSTHTDKYLDFHSHHPLSQKKSVVTTLLSCAKDLSSCAVSHKEERNHVVKALEGNGYPRQFIRRSAPSPTLPQSQEANSGDEDEDDAKKSPVVTLPCIRGLSETLKRILEQLNITVRFKPNNTLRRLLVRPKDPTPPEQRNGVIYRIPCKDCTMAHIGQSGRSLACRIKEHKRAVQNGDQNSSTLAEHAWQQQHHVDWAAAEVLESTRDWYPRCMIESWHIHREANSMNRERGPLPHIYCSLLTEQKQR